MCCLNKMLMHFHEIYLIQTKCFFYRFQIKYPLLFYPGKERAFWFLISDIRNRTALWPNLWMCKYNLQTDYLTQGRANCTEWSRCQMARCETVLKCFLAPAMASNKISTSHWTNVVAALMMLQGSSCSEAVALSAPPLPTPLPLPAFSSFRKLSDWG